MSLPAWAKAQWMDEHVTVYEKMVLVYVTMRRIQESVGDYVRLKVGKKCAIAVFYLCYRSSLAIDSAYFAIQLVIMNFFLLL